MIRIRSKAHKALYSFLGALTKIGILTHNVGEVSLSSTPVKRVPWNISTRRFKANLSYTNNTITKDLTDTFKFRGKAIAVFREGVSITSEIRMQIQITDFLINIDPSHSTWICNSSPIFWFVSHKSSHKPYESSAGKDELMVQREIVCDFMKCRYFLTKRHPGVYTPDSMDLTLKEMTQEATDHLMLKVSDLQMDLCGIPNDGCPVSKSSYSPLADNLVCGKCGVPVYSTIEPHQFECPKCGIIKGTQTERVPYEVWKDQYIIFEDCILSKGN